MKNSICTSQHNTPCIYVQLSLFPETIEERNTREIAELRKALEKNRKGLHAKHGNLQRAYDEIKNELEHLKSAICKNQSLNQNQMVIF